MTKMTKATVFTAIIDAIKAHPDVMSGEVSADSAVSALAHEIELLAKKKSAKKPTKVQVENAELAVKIAEVMADMGKATAKDIRLACIDAGILSADATPQKMSALLSMVDGCVKETEKGKTYFSLIG